MKTVRHVTLVLLIGCAAACSRQDAGRIAPTIDYAQAPADEVMTAAEGGDPAAQRELAGRMLFGRGMPADPVAASMWAERAAMGGDDTAAIWMGRLLLKKTAQRVEAAAWFMVAAASTNPAVRQDAAGELAALVLSANEQTKAALRAKDLKDRLPGGSE